MVFVFLDGISQYPRLALNYHVVNNIWDPWSSYPMSFYTPHAPPCQISVILDIEPKAKQALNQLSCTSRSNVFGCLGCFGFLVWEDGGRG